MLLTTIRYIILCAIRDKLFIGLIAAILLAAFLGSFMGSAAFLENKEMSLVMTASVARLIVVIGTVVFICFQLRSHFDNKEMDVLLTRPLTRETVVIAYWLGFAAVASIALIPLFVVVAFIGPLSWQGFGLWALSLLAEIWIVAALALFAAMVLKSAAISVMATLGMYVMGRMMILFVMSAEKPAGDLDVLIGGHVLKAISVIMPRLDLFAKSEWLVYGVAKFQDAWLITLQLGIWVPLLLLATLLDFRKKQF